MEEEMKLMEALEQHDCAVTFLEDDFGLGFAPLDEVEDGIVPIWVERDEVGVEMVPATPVKQMMLPTPPSTEMKKPVT
jgi:hypothetical protein